MTKSDGIPRALTEHPSRAIAVQLPLALRPYARSLLRWRPGCTVDLLRDGDEAFPAMLAAIAAAKTTIDFETYILASDVVGDRFKAALVERARAGVKVRLVYDAIGSFGIGAVWLHELRDAGVEIATWNPIALWRRRFWMRHRDHRKILVVDHAIAFTGGINISRDYVSVAAGGSGWHDMHCRVRGPIVLDLARMFRRTWLTAGGTSYRAPPPPDRAEGVGGTSYVRLLDNTRRRSRATVRRAYLHVIKTARSSVLLQNAYFLPDLGLRRALVKAVKRGADVRVVVPGRSDVKLVEWATLYVTRRLASRGVKVLRWRGPMMHAKSATVDGVWSTIGSYNFDAQSRFKNLEVTVEILDPATGTTLMEMFERDVENCEPYDEHSWHHLSWWRKALAWGAYRLRRWL